MRSTFSLPSSLSSGVSFLSSSVRSGVSVWPFSSALINLRSHCAHCSALYEGYPLPKCPNGAVALLESVRLGITGRGELLGDVPQAPAGGIVAGARGHFGGGHTAAGRLVDAAWPVVAPAFGVRGGGRLQNGKNSFVDLLPQERGEPPG